MLLVLQQATSPAFEIKLKELSEHTTGERVDNKIKLAMDKVIKCFLTSFFIICHSYYNIIF